jgi:tubulin-specific chaperone B
MKNVIIQKVGDRCKVTDYGHRGTIKYVGKIKEMAEGYFVGIQLDEPFGKNDGR